MVRASVETKVVERTEVVEEEEELAEAEEVEEVIEVEEVDEEVEEVEEEVEEVDEEVWEVERVKEVVEGVLGRIAAISCTSSYQIVPVFPRELRWISQAYTFKGALKLFNESRVQLKVPPGELGELMALM